MRLSPSGLERRGRERGVVIANGRTAPVSSGFACVYIGAEELSRGSGERRTISGNARDGRISALVLLISQAFCLLLCFPCQRVGQGFLLEKFFKNVYLIQIFNHTDKCSSSENDIIINENFTLSYKTNWM